MGSPFRNTESLSNMLMINADQRHAQPSVPLRGTDDARTRDPARGDRCWRGTLHRAWLRPHNGRPDRCTRGRGRATVFKAVGGKAALLCAAHRLAIVGVDDPRPPHEAGLTQRWAGVMGAVALLERYVAVVTDVFESVGPIHEVLAGCLGVRGTTRSARRPGPRAARGRYPDRAASR